MASLLVLVEEVWPFNQSQWRRRGLSVCQSHWSVPNHVGVNYITYIHSKSIRCICFLFYVSMYAILSIVLLELFCVYCTDVLRLTVANRAERGGSPVCNGSVSSLSECTHSSLNTDQEEDELEHRRETNRETSTRTSRQRSRESPDGFLRLLGEGTESQTPDIMH